MQSKENTRLHSAQICLSQEKAALPYCMSGPGCPNRFAHRRTAPSCCASCNQAVSICLYSLFRPSYSKNYIYNIIFHLTQVLHDCPGKKSSLIFHIQKYQCRSLYSMVCYELKIKLNTLFPTSLNIGALHHCLIPAHKVYL